MMIANHIKVLFNTPSPKLHGGPPIHLPLLEKELRKYVYLETFKYGRRTDSETTVEKLLARTKDLLNLRSTISQFQPDIIHHNTAFDSMAILRDAPLVWLTNRRRVPLLLKMHGSVNELFGRIAPPLRQLRDTILKSTACIGVLSTMEREEYLKAWPFLAKRIRVVKNIIKPLFHSVIRQETESPMVLFLSRFMREKGIFDLLEAVPGVIRKFPKAQFIFIGSGSDTDHFDKVVRESKLNESVIRIEHIDNAETAKFYASAWVLVFPTRRLQEGMPMVVAEAMAAGVPIITTKTKFSQSYMRAEQHCLYIDYGNPVSIENQIIYLFENAGLRAQMAISNRELAKSFLPARVTREFLDIYYDTISTGSTKQSWSRS